MATHSSILAWGIPRTEEPGGLQSTGSQRVRHDSARSTQTEAQLKDLIPKHATKRYQSQNSNPGSAAFRPHVHNFPTAGTRVHS